MYKYMNGSKSWSGFKYFKIMNRNWREVLSVFVLWIYNCLKTNILKVHRIHSPVQGTISGSLASTLFSVLLAELLEVPWNLDEDIW